MNRSLVGAQRGSSTPPRYEATKRVLKQGYQSGMEPLTSLLMVVSAAFLALVFALVTAVYSIQA